MNTQQQANAGLEKIREMVEPIRIAMLTTLNEQEHLVSRPMACLELDAEGAFWFFTKKTSPKVQQVSQIAPQVNLSFANPDTSDYVSVSGRAQELDDRAKIDELWSDEAKNWFPKGKDDPELTLLKVTTDTAEYWDSTDSKLVRLFQMARAAVTGNTYPDGGDHAKVSHQ